MTRAELMESIKHLKWERKQKRLRCEKGDCPIIAAAKIRGLITEGYSPNWSFVKYGRLLGLSDLETDSIASDADWGIVPELEL